MLSETFLAMTIFKNDIDSVFVFSFATLMTLKVFHWILRDRIDYVIINIYFTCLNLSFYRWNKLCSYQRVLFIKLAAC